MTQDEVKKFIKDNLQTTISCMTKENNQTIVVELRFKNEEAFNSNKIVNIINATMDGHTVMKLNTDKGD